MPNLAIKSKAKIIKVKGRELSNDVLATLEVMSLIVGSTLGPGGNPVLLERPGLPPLITKDGVTVASHLAFENPLRHVIAEAAKEASLRTNREAGDGTTTAIVLAEALVRSGMDFLEKNPGRSPQEVCRELNQILDTIIEHIKSKSVPVSTLEDMTKVSLIASNNDQEIADAVVKAIDLVGNDGTIITEEGSSRHTQVELQDGFPVQKGLSSFGPQQEIFINDQANQECRLEDPFVLLYDGDLLMHTDLVGYIGNVLETLKAAQEKPRPFLIVAHKFSDTIQKLFAMNFQAGTLYLVPLETPFTAQPNSRHHFLHDLACITGAKVLDPITNTLATADMTALGSIGSVRVGRYQSLFFDPPEDNTIEERHSILDTQVNNAESDYDREIIKERIGRLLGGIATIYVGGSSDLEVKEKKHRIEDAICATRSAIDMGILPGGGATLLCFGQEMITRSSELPPSATILGSALQVPFVRIAKNAGENEKQISEAAVKVLASATQSIPSLVYDSFKHELVEPMSAGVVDPVKVTISALTNALSISTMLMCLGGAIVLPRDAADERNAEAAAQQFAAQMQT